jgi:predicted Zn-dependent protease
VENAMPAKIYRSVALSLLAGLAGGCATNKITGRTQAMMVSDAQAAQQSAQAYSQLLQEAHQKRTLDDDAAELARVQSIAKPLVTQATVLRPETKNWHWDVHVLKSDEVNAWCMAGGKIAVYTGLLNKIKPTDDELAAVMGHEIAHALLSHQAEKMSRAQMQQAGIGLGVLAAGMMGYNLGGLASLADGLATVGLQLPNSREAESEADSVGLELSARGGFNPEAAVTLWQKMLKEGGSGGPDWLSTHPNPQSRIDSMRIKAKQLMPVYEAVKSGQPIPQLPLGRAS